MTTTIYRMPGGIIVGYSGLRCVPLQVQYLCKDIKDNWLEGLMTPVLIAATAYQFKALQGWQLYNYTSQLGVKNFAF